MMNAIFGPGRKMSLQSLAQNADLPGFPTKCCQRAVLLIIPPRALKRIKQKGKPDEKQIKSLR